MTGFNDNTLTWEVVFAMVGVGAILLMFVSILILRLTLDRRVRKALPPDKIYDSPHDWYFGYGRTIAFGAACVFNYINNSPKLRYLYDDFDVRAFANRFEKVIAYCMVGSFVFFMMCGCIMYITDLLGIHDWS
jgi:hypothetical protein